MLQPAAVSYFPNSKKFNLSTTDENINCYATNKELTCYFVEYYYLPFEFSLEKEL